jgi:ATP-dependent DNA ligase
MIGRRDGDSVRIFTRRGHDWGDRVPVITEAMASLPVTSATIDGEAMLTDHSGVSDFDALRAALTGSRSVFLMAFDMIELNGTDLRAQPWIGRRELLIDLVGKDHDGLPCRSTSRARMVRRSIRRHAAWGLRASSRSASIAAIARDARRIG